MGYANLDDASWVFYDKFVEDAEAHWASMTPSDMTEAEFEDALSGLTGFDLMNYWYDLSVYSNHSLEANYEA